jgi:general secretion pathway protein L
VDWGLVRRLAWLMLAVLSVSLLISLVQILRYNLAADALERQADLLARQALPRGETVNDADRQLDARLSGLRGGGAGFARTAAAVFAAVRALPGVELRTISFEANGDLTVTVATENEGQITDIESRIASYGFVPKSGPLQSGGGRVSGTITVSPR